jgi:PAS domain S-box-containing protein
MDGPTDAPPPRQTASESDDRIAELVDQELKRCLDHAAEALHWVGPDGTIEWANQTELDHLGYTREEYIGHNIVEFHVDRAVIDDILLRLSKGETLHDHEARLRRRDGSIRYVQINSNVQWRDGRFQHTRCFTRDVTERRVADEVLLRLADIVEHSDDAIVSKDLDGIITSWNPAAERMFGYTAAEAVSQSILLIIPADRRHEENEVLRRIRAGDVVEAFETVRQRKDGSPIELSVRISPIRDRRGRVIGASKMARDITQLKRLQARDRFLVQLDDAVRPLANAEEITFTAATALGQYLRVNRCAYATVADDEDAFILTGNYIDGVPSIVGRYTFRQFGEECLRLMRAGQPYTVTDSDVDPRITDAERVSYTKTAIRAVICVPIMKTGRFVGAMAVHTIAAREWAAGEVELVEQVAGRCWESIERARVTQEMRDREEQFRVLANSIANLAWMARPDGSIYWFNDQWYGYTGTTLAEVAGWGWQSVHDPAALPAVKDRWMRSIADGTPFEMVYPLRGADGQFRRFLTRINPVRNSEGQIVQWLGTNTDVEDERRATEANALLRDREQLARQEAELLRSEAESANRAKDEFLAMLGHELRNPLAPILTALQLMKLRGNDSCERERTVIDRQVTHLTRLVDDLLDVSRIARGKVDLKEEVIEISEVVARAIEVASPLLEERTHSLTVHVKKRGLSVQGDPTRLGQVVSNLLTNAAKYTAPGGRITVQAEAEGGEAVLRVRDTGMGIAPEVLPRIFDLFVQERQAIDRAQGGLGLGLTIVRNLVERHGGSVTATSDGPGHGSEFVVRLPLANAALTADAGRPAARRRGVSAPVPGTSRVLVVDDNQDAADMLAETLRASGYETRVALDGPSALREAEIFAPDIAFLDIGLPVMDGHEVAARLRELPGMQDIRLVAVTGYGQESDRVKSRLAGFQHHLVKPVDFKEIESIVAGRSAK